MLDMGIELFALRDKLLDGGVFTRTSKGTIVANEDGHRLSTARSKDRGMIGFIRKAQK